MLKAIVFDFDGVIADTYEMSFQIYQSLYPKITQLEFKELHSGNLLKKADWTEKKRAIFGQRRQNLFRQGCNHIFTGMSEFIIEMSRQFSLFIISSSDDGFIEQYLDRINMTGELEQILGGRTEKSKVKKFQMVFEKYHLEPTEMVFVTDTTGDINDAKEVAVPVVAVTWGYHDRDRLEKAQPDYIVDSVEELEEVIKNMSSSKH